MTVQIFDVDLLIRGRFMMQKVLRDRDEQHVETVAGGLV